MKKRAEEWLKFSKIDLDSALKLLEDPGLTQSVAFHCQQTIEKAFKAILEEKNLKVPRLHDLEKLFGMVEECGLEMQIDEDVLDEINDVYIETRYPSNSGLIPDGIPKIETVKKFYNQAESVYKQVLTLLNK